MIRALVALLGFAAAAVLLAIAPNAGDLTGDKLWYVAGIWAAAGLVAGILYQAGGVRRPGMRLNLPMLFIAWLPWTLLSIATIVQMAEPGSDIARLARDIFPDTWLAHWVFAMSAMAFASGLLLAFSLIEPRVAVTQVVMEDERTAVAGGRPAMGPAATMDTAPRTTIADDATDLDEQPTPVELRDREAAARDEGAREQAAQDEQAVHDEQAMRDEQARREDTRMARSTGTDT